jgi:hypothetical protein
MSFLRDRFSGIVLISSLLFLVLIVIFATAVISIAMSQQKYTKNFYMNQVAVKAAESGINYAMSRIENSFNWMGCQAPGTDVKLSFENKLEIYEHTVKNQIGCVEGRIRMGGYTGYFDMYFLKPSNDNNMKFFKNNGVTYDGESGPGSIPENIILSLNNSVAPGMFNEPAVVKDSSGKNVKTIPSNSVLLVCRGKCGNSQKTIETCFRLTHNSSYDAVAVSKKDINIILNAEDGKSKIEIKRGNDNKPSLLRAAGAINIKVKKLFNSGFDYLKVDNSCGGYSDLSPTFSPKPKNYSNSFKTMAGQADYLPPLKLDMVKPKEEVTNVLPAGTYVITARTPDDPDYNKSPMVLYFKDIDPYLRQDSDDPNKITGVKTISDLQGESDAITYTNYVHSNIGKIFSWDVNTRKLKILSSIKVNSASDSSGNVFSGIVFTSGSLDRLSIQLGADGNNPTYLINDCDNGSIYVDGEIYGFGTVISSGNIDIQAASKVNADVSTGISIYGGGDVVIHPITGSPFVSGNFLGADTYNSKVSAYNKIKTIVEINNKLPEMPSDPSLVDENVSYRQDRLEISAGIFTDKEKNVINQSFFSKDKDNKAVLGIDLTNPESEVTVTWEGNIKTVYYPYDNPDCSRSISKRLYTNPRESMETQYDSQGKIIKLEDSVFKGLVFACRDFTVDTPGHRFSLEGALVALGGDFNGNLHDSKGGNIYINSKDCELRYDSKYLSLLTHCGLNVMTLYWTEY